jgi:hypothetical protein
MLSAFHYLRIFLFPLHPVHSSQNSEPGKLQDFFQNEFRRIFMLITDIIDRLISLCNLDNDAIKSYDIAIKKISEQDISSSIKAFREDHVRHVESLTRIITGLGGAHPIPTGGDIRGLFLGAITALQSSFGTEGALKGLQGGEKITTRSYEDAVGQDFPPDILSVLSRNYQDEKVHFEQVTKMIDSSAWENRRAA